jgi:type II secretory pathway component PulK
MTNRRGFALATVLWVMAVGSVMAALATIVGRSSVDATRNRTQLARAYWTAVACLARARAAIDETLTESGTLDGAVETWRALDRGVAPIDGEGASTCETTLEAAGTRLDINAASEEMLGTLLRAMGYDEATAGDMAASFTDWRATHGAFADLREIALVPGFEELARFDSVLSVEPGRVSLATAPATVLLALPGMTNEAAEQIVGLRETGTPLRDLLSLLGMLSETSRAAMLARYPDLTRFATTDPDAWVLTVRATSGAPAATVTLQLRLQRSGTVAVVTASRTTT